MRIDSDALYVYVGRKLRKRRRALGWTQAQVAQSLGLSRTSVTNIEAGRQKLPLDLLYELSIVLGIDVLELVPPVDHLPTVIEIVTGLEGEMQPRTASLVRTLQNRLEEGRDADR